MSARTTVPGLLVVAKAAARAGADVLARRWTGHHPAVPLGIEEIGAQTKSSGSDWVTDYDRRAEQAVREVVAGYRPSDEITGEDGNKLYRARLIGLGEKDARKACTELQNQSMPCMAFKANVTLALNQAP